MSTTAATIWRHPSAVLLAAQLLALLVYPFLGDSPTGRGLLSLVSLVVLVLAVRAIRATPAWTWASWLVGIPVAVLTVAEAFAPTNEPVVLWSSILHAIFYLYASSGFLRYMFLDRTVTPDELFATGATFTVVAWAFAYLYVAVQIFWPGSFTAAIDAESPRTWVELLFLSVTTLTSTGLSDVVPVQPHARALVMVEQVAGLMYVALVISRIVGLTLARDRASREDA
jgi:Ion channel